VHHTTKMDCSGDLDFLRHINTLTYLLTYLLTLHFCRTSVLTVNIQRHGTRKQASRHAGYYNSYMTMHAMDVCVCVQCVAVGLGGRGRGENQRQSQRYCQPDSVHCRTNAGHNMTVLLLHLKHLRLCSFESVLCLLHVHVAHCFSFILLRLCVCPSVRSSHSWSVKTAERVMSLFTRHMILWLVLLCCCMFVWDRNLGEGQFCMMVDMGPGRGFSLLVAISLEVSKWGSECFWTIWTSQTSMKFTNF